MIPSSIHRALEWLENLADSAETLPRPSSPRLYYSQRGGVGPEPRSTALTEVARRVNQLVRQMQSEMLFAQFLGYDCVDDYGAGETSPSQELETRLGKGWLWDGQTAEWSEDDLCDFIEVFHDLASRPTREHFHSYNGCGWHPTAFSRNSGRALYRWRINGLLLQTGFALRLADQGEDIGRMVHATDGELRFWWMRPSRLNRSIAPISIMQWPSSDLEPGRARSGVRRSLPLPESSKIGAIF
jgi:hypothetical protein